MSYSMNKKTNIRNLSLCIIYTFLYFIFAISITLLYPMNSYGIPFWPAAGIGLGAMIRMGYSAWIVTFVGAFCFSSIIRGAGIGYAAMEGLGSSMGVLVCFTLLNKHNFDSALLRVYDLWLLVASAALSSAIFSNINLFFIYYSNSDVSPEIYINDWFKWWTGDALGVLILTPLVLTWTDKSHYVFAKNGFFLRGTLYLTVFICGYLGLIVSSKVIEELRGLIVMATFPSLAWAVLRFSLRDVVLCIFTASFFSLVIFGYQTPQSIESLMFFMWMTALMALSIHIAISSNRLMLIQLNEKNEQLTSLIETFPDGIFLNDGLGQCQIANRAGLAITQLNDKSDWYGKTERQLAVSSQSDDMRLLFEYCSESTEMAFKNGRLMRGERKIKKKNGAARYLEIRKFPRLGKNGDRVGIVTIVRNITKQKSITETLRQSTIQYQKQVRLLQTVLDALPAQVGLFDKNGSIVAVNRSWLYKCQHACTKYSDVKAVCGEHLTGCPQLTDMPISGYVNARNGIFKVLHGEAPQFVYEFSETCSNQFAWRKMIVTPIDPKLIGSSGVVVMILDVTQSKISGDIVRQRERQYRAITEHSPDMILRVGPSGRILFANKALTSFLRRNGFGLIGQKVIELWGDEHVASLWNDAIDRIINGAQQRIELVFETNDADQIGRRVFQAYMVHDGVDNEITILVVIRDITEIKEKEDRLIESHKQLRLFAAESEMVREAEKKHIARELHDDLGQLLSALRFDIGLLKMQYAASAPELEPRLIKMMDILERAIECTRNAVDHIRPNVLDIGLDAALEWLRDDFEEMFGIDCELQIKGEIPELSEEQVTVLFRIMQESLTNIAKHACATSASIQFWSTNNLIYLVVRDNGIGFDFEGVDRNKKCFGLLGMEERAIALGGSLTIETKPGFGCSTMLTIPISSKNESS
ncbi:PAS domain S-box protein [Methylotuvimicrobium buryatense]|uniref:PAS domain S-box protein n=2 Tax=Methylotuvimicrobium buryatense TaxID=95641 RepID=A0A4P9UN45_METBY|nr:PAS domain S-box protein [Methylotuvimicrobium buryatense]